MNPAFVKWMAEKEERAASRASASPLAPPLTYRPSPVNRAQLQDKSIVPIQARGSAYPSTYDLRTLNRVSPVKDQNPWGTCWTFAASASAESSTLTRTGGAVTSADYSEKFLAYYGYTDIDSNYVAFDRDSSGSVYDEGGNNEISTAINSRWNGIVAETTVPYQDMGSGGTIPPADATNTAWLSNTYIAPSGASVVDNIKYLLTTYGAVSVSIYASDSYLNSSTGAHYFNASSATNHAVTVVGWDDNYSTANFRGDQSVPQGNGAWIVKNSWGEGWGSTWGGSWGGDGYFYVSYYDSGVQQGGVAFQTEDAQDGYHLYLHDYLGEVSSFVWGDASEQWMSNFFTATGNQSLMRVALTTQCVNTMVNIYVVKNATYANDDINGDTVTHAGDPVLISTTISEAGYHTLDLPAPVSVSSGEQFAIIARYQTSGCDFPLPIEKPQAGFSSKATASAGQSYCSYYSGQTLVWKDLTTIAASYSNANFCLRAIAGPESSGSINMVPVNTLLLN